MPFIAEGKNGDGVWERIDITRYEVPKRALADYSLRCQDPECNGEMIIKHGNYVVAHFAHKTTPAPGSRCIYAGVGETEQHRIAKLELVTKLKAKPDYSQAKFMLEKILVGDGRKRKADLLVEFPSGVLEVHEIQLSRTTIQECRERTRDYTTLGVDTVVWWFGNDNANDGSLIEWARSECGLCGRLEIRSQTVVI